MKSLFSWLATSLRIPAIVIPLALWWIRTRRDDRNRWR